MDGALTFIHICVDSSQTVLEHHRSFAPFTMYIYILSIVCIKSIYICLCCTKISLTIPKKKHPKTSDSLLYSIAMTISPKAKIVSARMLIFDVCIGPGDTPPVISLVMLSV